MIRYAAGIYLLIFLNAFSKAQIICPAKDYCVASNLFNPAFIKMNRISTVRASLSLKKNMRPIRNLGLFVYYGFNEAGYLTDRYETYYKKGGQIDTMSVHYEYDASGRQLMSRKSDSYGFFQLKWKYDTSGRITEETYSRIENTAASLRHFKPGREYIIRRETYTYSPSENNQMKKSYYNASGKLYKERMQSYDAHGNLKESTERFIVTNRRSQITFAYDEYNRMIRKTEYASLNRSDSTLHLFKYDTLGNIEEERVMRNGMPLKLLQFIYDRRTYLLDAMLEKEESSGNITITRFTYEYRR